MPVLSDGVVGHCTHLPERWDYMSLGGRCSHYVYLLGCMFWRTDVGNRDFHKAWVINPHKT